MLAEDLQRPCNKMTPSFADRCPDRAIIVVNITSNFFIGPKYEHPSLNLTLMLRPVLVCGERRVMAVRTTL